MHITEGVLTGPSAIITNVVGGALIVAGAAAMNRFTKEQPQRKPLLGMAGAFIFFVSLIHLPAFGGLTCSHPCGTPLAGILLGPWTAIGLAACSLLMQALFFAHGGLSTLGANTITLGLAGAGLGWLTFKLGRKAGLSLWWAAALGGLVGDIGTYAVNILQLGLHLAYVAPTPQYSFSGYAKVLTVAYLPVQGPLAIAEMLVTGYAVSSIGKQRPEVLEGLGVIARQASRQVKTLLVLFLIGAAGLIRAAAPSGADSGRDPGFAVPRSTGSAAPEASLSPTAEAFGALDDMTNGMAAKAGTPSRDPYIDLEKYPEIWSSMMMFAGLAVGFILGRWWHLLFIPAVAAPLKKKR